MYPDRDFTYDLRNTLIQQVTSLTEVTLDDGLHLAYGTRISVAAYAIHWDDDFRPEATTYDPARHDNPESSTPASHLPITRSSESFSSLDWERILVRVASL